ncbi:MAG: carbon storage regulator [Gemmataceae bacterium]
MLVLTRKCQESVVVGRADTSDALVTVTVLEITGHNVRLGFVADTTIAVHRWEVWEKLHDGLTDVGVSG